MSAGNIVSMYNALANQTWQRMVEQVGIHTVTILVQRSIWMTRQKYSEATLIELDDTGICFDNLAEIEPGAAKALLEEFFASLISILTRLVGRKITGKLLADLDRLIALEEGA